MDDPSGVKTASSVIIKGPRHASSETPPNAQWWGPLLGILIVVSLYIVPEFVALPLAYTVFTAIGNTGGYEAFLQWTTTIIGNITFTAITDGLILAAVWFFAIKKKGTLAMLGLTRFHLKYLLQALLVFIAYLGFYLFIVIGVSLLVPGFNAEQERDIGFNNPAGYRELLGTFVVLALITPLVEEIMFRGFLFGGFRKKFPLWLAALLTSLIFGAAHLSSMGSGSPVWVAALDTFVLSMVLCYMRDRLRSLWPMVGVHGLKNAMAFVFLYLIH